MHQSKKELHSRQFNQMLSMDLHNRIEYDSMLENELISREITPQTLLNTVMKKN